jgi:hypothetical protein
MEVMIVLLVRRVGSTGSQLKMRQLKREENLSATRCALTGTMQLITLLVVQPWLDFPSPRVIAVKIWPRGGPMSAAGFVFSGKVWVLVRMPALVMPVTVLGLLLYVGSAVRHRLLRFGHIPAWDIRLWPTSTRMARLMCSQLLVSAIRLGP